MATAPDVAVKRGEFFTRGDLFERMDFFTRR